MSLSSRRVQFAVETHQRAFLQEMSDGARAEQIKARPPATITQYSLRKAETAVRLETSRSRSHTQDFGLQMNWKQPDCLTVTAAEDFSAPS